MVLRIFSVYFRTLRKVCTFAFFNFSTLSAIFFTFYQCEVYRHTDTDLSNVVEVVFPDRLGRQTLERHIRLGLQDDLGHTGGGGRQRGLAGRVHRVDVDAVVQQGHDDGVQRQEVRDDLLVGDDDVEGSVLGPVHSLGVGSGLEQQLGGGGTGELTHLVSVEII